MTEFLAWVLLGAAGVLFALAALFVYLSQRTPVDTEWDDGLQDEWDVAQVVQASRPAPLSSDRPHVRAGERK